MPRDRRDHSLSRDRSWASPYSSCSNHAKQFAVQFSAESEEDVKEWEEARCPACMEHPHNAVLLICTSHEKGCRPYMCNTSYRHSNCLDQFCKSFEETSPAIPEEGTEQTTTEVSEGSLSMHQSTCENEAKPKLLCPLCRGQVKEWKIVEAARRFLNEKSRSCSCETCNFSGKYTDLRKHARVEHPLVHPSKVDPEHRRKWKRLEQQRDIGDLLSTLQSSFADDMFDGTELPTDEGRWLTIFLIGILQPSASTRSGSWSSSASRTRIHMRIRRRSTRHWGETLDGEPGSSSRDDDHESSDGGSSPWRRVR